ncbi:SDR family NAD(P)-dependent oxidoreductase (plasmid) [Candidatus Fukatsuia symbiotica]|uniref:3-oxoacyl-ACP reductase n=1 Tax=Candidatus Fukatsuia symbiotica TaxID=1878942 RepID=A0A2U8I8S4_9GAMM|nr:SDR family NAD(P)-dependent oxidoreductase [Candidatus Fukatsuia symbiotica]AWK15517.1 3-oxoacyl-ACP reductase [Candidatus Fukatsuia symbiotica]MEA9445906.1 SDR family NAD(P)-dependent oxidoreductase [Candidatus Fukatsuia symbiotica]
MKWKNAIAIVTGAGSGIGHCFVEQLLRGGCRVAAVDKNTNRLEMLAREYTEHGDALQLQPLDVANEASVRSAFAYLTAHLGVPDILVNNAGVLRDGLLVQRDDEGYVRKLPTAQWRSVVETNLTGPFLLSREFVARRLETGIQGGLIVNISSVTSAGNPGQSSYAASKAGLDALTRTWALELAFHGIRVIGIAPGLTDTPMAATLRSAEREDLLAQIPLRRMATVKEIWLGLRFALECDYFNGRVLAIDGGASFN